MKSGLVPFSALILSLGFFSCSGNNDSETDRKESAITTYEDQKSQATTSLENVFEAMSKTNISDPTQIGNFDFETPRKMFEALAKQRPNDADVKISLGICQMLSLYADPQFKHFLSEMLANSLLENQTGNNPLSVGFIPFNILSVISQEIIGNSVLLMVKKGITDPNGIDILQAHFRTVIVPQLSAAIKNFEEVEVLTTSPQTEYQYALTGKMMGNFLLPTLYMDNTEFYLMDSYLEYLKGNLALYSIIDFKNSDFSGFSPDALTEKNLPELMSQVKLYPYGKEQSELFIFTMENAANDVLHSLKYLQLETDNQNDDMIKKNPKLNNLIGELITQTEAKRDELLSVIDDFIVSFTTVISAI